jgi:hypothetical protein
MNIFGAENDIELVVFLDDIAFTKRTGDDLHGVFLETV